MLIEIERLIVFFVYFYNKDLIWFEETKLIIAGFHQIRQIWIGKLQNAVVSKQSVSEIIRELRQVIYKK